MSYQITNSDLMREYRSKVKTPQQAAQMVQSNMVIEYGQHSARPVDFDSALAARAGDGLTNVLIRSGGTLPPVPETVLKDPEQKSFVYGSWYFSIVDRKMSDMGAAVHLPFNFSDANLLARSDYEHMWPDIWVQQVCQMSNDGMFNLGTFNAHSYTIGKRAKYRIVEVNPNMPRCLGGWEEALHISEVDAIIEGSAPPIFTIPGTIEPTENEKKIAQYVVEEIRDGSCLQLGIGGLPNYIGKLIAESDLKDLGIQTEMFGDSMVDLYEAGKITNACKTLDRYKSVYTFALGQKRTYEFMHDNARLASCPADYTNDPSRMRLNDQMVSINNILEIDLLTQVCSESQGLRQISGTGGQLDFVLGSFLSRGGKSFLAFTSTRKDKDGNVKSRIRSLLPQGSIVTVPRTCVHWLVTENGKACLKGMSVWERAEAIIGLAHPDFRDELIHDAAGMKIWRKTNKIG